MGRAEVPVVQMQGDVEEDEVEEHPSTIGDVFILGPLDQAEKRRDVLLVVDVGMPLREAPARALFDPSQYLGPGPRHVLCAVHPGHAEDAIGMALACQVLVDAEEQDVVLAPVPHLVHDLLPVDDALWRGIRVPVLEVEEGLVGRFPERLGGGGMPAERIEQVDQVEQVEVARVAQIPELAEDVVPGVGRDGTLGHREAGVATCALQMIQDVEGTRRPQRL